MSALGQKQTSMTSPRNVRFIPESGHWVSVFGCPLCAKSGHRTSYSITSSARPRSGNGIEIPSALAVWALMTSSNFVACRTGRSAGFSPLRMRTGVGTDLTISVAEISSVTHQAARHRVLSEWIYSGKCMAVGECDQLIAHCHEKRVSAQEECVSALRDQGRKGHFNFACGACIQKQQAQPQGVGRRLQLMSALGQKQTLRGVRPMSALPPKADID
jgi:hypothetical protein